MPDAMITPESLRRGMLRLRQRLSRTWRDVASEDEPIGKAIGKKARVVVDSSDEEGAHFGSQKKTRDNIHNRKKLRLELFLHIHVHVHVHDRTTRNPTRPGPLWSGGFHRKGV